MFHPFAGIIWFRKRSTTQGDSKLQELIKQYLLTICRINLLSRQRLYKPQPAMRRNTFTSESNRPESKRAKVEQSQPPSRQSDQNTALVESLRRQNAAFTRIAGLALINSSPINTQVTHLPASVRHNMGFDLLQHTGQQVPIDQTRSNSLGSQDDLLRIFLLEQQLRSSSSGYTSNLPRTSLVHATGLIDPSSSYNLARLNCIESSRNLSATNAQHLVDRLLALPVQMNIERLNGSLLGTELSHLNGLQRRLLLYS